MNYAYEVTNWSNYQYYSKRNPPWICLHYEILTSEMWVCCSDESRVLAIACMLVASRHDGKIPENTSHLRRVAYLSSEPDFSELVRCGFLTDLRDLHADECKLHASACDYVYDMNMNMKKKERKKEQFSEEAGEVLEHLNSVTGKKFTNTREIKSCFKREACSVDECKEIIDFKWKEWAGTDMAKHVNPVTPFRKSHFCTYLDEARAGAGKASPEKPQIRQYEKKWEDSGDMSEEEYARSQAILERLRANVWNDTNGDES